jgi:lipopolysaccharide/colanic/teichoic acid biosynthesis glycosyltransferase
MHLPLPTSRSGKRIYLSAWDLSWAVISPILALYIRDPQIVLRADWAVVGSYWGLAAGFAVFAFFAFRLQDGMTRYFSMHEALDVAEAVLFAQLMTFLALFTITRLDGIPRSVPVTHGLLLLGGLIAARIIMRVAFSEDDEVSDFRARRERIIVIGANRFASCFIRLLQAYGPQRQSVIAVLDDNRSMVGKALSGVRVLGAAHELDAVIGEFAVHGVNADRVVIAGEANFVSPKVLQEIERVCRKRHIPLAFLPRMIGLTEQTEAEAPIAPVAAKFVLADIPSFFRVKRLIDVVAAATLLIVLSPGIFIASLLVLYDVGRPLLFWQERLGWKGRSFLIYKFRTLRAPYDEAGSLLEKERQPSAIGRFLRATRLDEVPQLFNVLLGDMSVIGPRPLLPEDQPDNIAVRLSVRPGISGWAQVNGGKLVSKEEKEDLDEWYIRNASLGLDLKIAAKTLAMILGNRPSSDEALADVAQVQTKASELQCAAAPELAAVPPTNRAPERARVAVSSH